MTTAATHHEQSHPTEATLFLAFELSGHWFSVMGIAKYRRLAGKPR